MDVFGTYGTTYGGRGVDCEELCGEGSGDVGEECGEVVCVWKIVIVERDVGIVCEGGEDGVGGGVSTRREGRRGDGVDVFGGGG